MHARAIPPLSALMHHTTAQGSSCRTVGIQPSHFSTPHQKADRQDSLQIPIDSTKRGAAVKSKLETPEPSPSEGRARFHILLSPCLTFRRVVPSSTRRPLVIALAVPSRTIDSSSSLSRLSFLHQRGCNPSRTRGDDSTW